jgi:hypothetical protein
MTYPDHSFSGQRGRQTLRSQEQPWTPTPARRTSVPDAGTDEPAYESEEHDTIPDPPSFWQICETWMNLVVDWFSSIWTRVWDWLVVDGYVDAALTEPLLRR